MKLNVMGMALAMLSGLAFAQSSTPDLAALAKQFSPALLKVEYQLQFDQGDSPRGAVAGERCPNCGRVHGDTLKELLDQERPLQAAGFLIAPNRVASPDLQIHQRFIKSILVRHGSQEISARPIAYAQNMNAVILDLEKPMADAQPLNFQADAQGPYFWVGYQQLNGLWTAIAQPLSALVALPEAGTPFASGPGSGLVANQAGVVAGLSLSGELPKDGRWKGSPAQWPLTSLAEQEQQLGQLQKICDQALLRVQLNFRSPKTPAQQQMRYRPRDEQEEDAAERDVVGLVYSATQVLVLAPLKPKVTARLQRITVYPGQGDPITAQFAGTLKDYGAFLAKLDKPLPHPVVLAKTSLPELRQARLLAARVMQHGEKRQAQCQHARVESFSIGFKGQLNPEFPADPEGHSFLFETSGQLLAIPLPRRHSPKTERSYESDEKTLTPVKYLAELFAQPDKFVDAGNAPLSEEQENRLAWLGVELQALNQELARANNVADQTQDGETGALVTYVYPDSLAAKAGIEPGFVLLRLRLADQPAPIDIKIQDDETYHQPFPWDRLDQVPEQYFERIPPPWPSAENAFTRLLTDLGIGTRYTAEFYANGKLIAKEFQVENGPPHFASAPRFKSESLGLTLRDQTYEVRRYLQKKADEPGVVISKIEPGSKASVSGLKPFELITHVNDQPVMNVKDFEKFTAQPGETRLSVKRMAAGRIVNLRAKEK